MYGKMIMPLKSSKVAKIHGKPNKRRDPFDVRYKMYCYVVE